MDNKMSVRLAALMFAVLLIASGCSDEDESPLTPGTGDNIPASSLPFPDTPEQLMANFRTIYETMDVNEYRLILDPAFETILQQGTQDDFPGVGVTLDVTEENHLHDRMFLGVPLQDANGDLLPAIYQFNLSRFQPVVDWGESLPSDPIPNTLSALYDVEILVDLGQEYSTLVVRGSIRFYVTSRDSLHEGAIRPYYQMIGQVDQTGGIKSIENSNWGSVKALWR